jgi:glycosyltransferase involved in cell wall biosynthesis
VNVLMAATEFRPATLGGSAESVRLTAEALAARGHRVGVVTPLWSFAPGPRTELVNGVAIERFPTSEGSAWTWGSERETASLRFWRWAANVIEDIATAGIGCDVIHAQDRRMIVPVFLAARRTRRPSILTLRDIGARCPIATCMVFESEHVGGAIPDDCGPLRLFNRCAPLFQNMTAGGSPYALIPSARLVARYGILAWERRLARRFSRIAYVSAGLAQHYARVFPGPPTTLHSPVAPVPPHLCASALSALPPAQRPIILFVGKCSYGKGYPDFFGASSLLGVDTLRFVQIGPKPGLANRGIEHLGVLPPAEVESWRCRASVCVVPSRQADALPRTALEAMAHGVPTVGTDVGGIPEILDAAGWLVPAGNYGDLAAAIHDALKNPWDVSQRLKAAEATQERFGPEAVAEAHERVYQEIRR